MSEIFETLSWIDLTAIAIVIVFLILGLFRGLVWQVSRVATLIAAYVLSASFGSTLEAWTTSWFPEGTAPELPRYVAYFLLFLVALILLSIIAAFVHKVVSGSPLSFYNRVGGGLLGVATGWLIVMALLTGVQMAHGTIGFGASIAEAASVSRSRAVSDVVLETTGDVLPGDWRDFTDGWRALLGGDDAGGDGTERSKKGGDRDPSSPESRR